MAIQSITKTIFTTTDGKEFSDFDAANAHEAVLESQAVVDRYIAEKYADSGRFTVTLKNAILGFLEFQASNDAEPTSEEMTSDVEEAA